VKSLIHASPIHLQIFRANRPTVLDAVLGTAFSAPGLFQAAHACAARDIRYCRDQDDRLLKIEAFLDGDYPDCNNLRDEDMFQLCRLWFCIDHFVDDYAKGALERLASVA
jgi:hypothetical protein